MFLASWCYEDSILDSMKCKNFKKRVCDEVWHRYGCPRSDMVAQERNHKSFREDKSVEQYCVKHKITLMYPSMPCIVVKENNV